MANNAEMVIDLDKKRMRAMADKDIATLDALLADDLVYTHSSARLDAKQSLIPMVPLTWLANELSARASACKLAR